MSYLTVAELIWSYSPSVGNLSEVLRAQMNVAWLMRYVLICANEYLAIMHFKKLF